MKRPSLPTALLLTLSLLSLACEAETPGHLTSAARPIVNGEVESGWEGVGAMTAVYPGRGYLGAFCSGSLIAPQWVLTAAHCVKASADLPLEADMMAFYVGPDANPVGGERPTEGRFLPIDAVRIYPDYVEFLAINDIALAHLAEPATDLPVYAFRREHLTTSDVVGRRATYVGYGVTDGVQRVGSGIKRSTTLLIDALLDWYYRSVFEGSGVCFGDSGGPGLMELDGEWQVIGVNSTVVGGNPDPCSHKSTHTRVDAFAEWIAATLDGPQPDCREDAAMCLCPEGCRADGGCDNGACQILGCRAVRACQATCAWDDEMCPSRCRRRASAEGEARLVALESCRIRSCAARNEDLAACLAEKCAGELATCEQLAVGDASCRAVADCGFACGGDEGCLLTCQEHGSQPAQVAFQQLFGCWQRDCADGAPEEREACLAAACPGFLDTCWQPARCDLRGGDCPAGRVCVETVLTANDCRPSAGDLEPGAACDLETELPCADGLRCADEGVGPRCAPLCLSDEDCPEAVACDPTWGVCFCTDEDEDGVCDATDCDDANPEVHPGAPELCDNGVDDDCDGETDEDCQTPGESGGGGCQASGDAGPWAPLFLLLLALGARTARWRARP